MQDVELREMGTSRSEDAPWNGGQIKSKLHSIWPWIQSHKIISVSVLVATVFLLSIASVMIGLFVTLSKLKDITMSEEMIIDVRSLCAQENSYRLITSLQNPCTIGATVKDVSMSIQYQGVEIMTTVIPSFELNHGQVVIDYESTFTIENEQLSGQFLNGWLNGEIKTLILKYEVEVVALGITFSSEFEEESIIGEPVEGVEESSYSIEYIHFMDMSQSDYLTLGLGIQYLRYDTSVSLNVPVVSLDVLHSGTVIGNVTVESVRIQDISTSVPTNVFIHGENSTVDILRNLVQSYLDGNEEYIQLTGAEGAPQDCMMQRLLNFVVIQTNLTSEGNSSLEIGNVNITNVGDDSVSTSIGFSLPYNFTGFTPDVTLEVKDTEKNSQLARIQLEELNSADSMVALEIFVDQPSDTAQFLMDLIDGKEVFLALQILINNDTNLLSKILNDLQWNFNISQGDTDTGSSFSISKVKLLGTEQGTNRVKISIDFSFELEVAASLPAIFFQLEQSGSGIFADLETEILTITEQDRTIILVFTLTDGSVLSGMVDNAFEGKNLTVGLLSNKPDGHVIQKIAQHWRYNWDLVMSQSSDGSSTVTGGIMPAVNLTIGDSTSTTLEVFISLNVDLPLDFTVELGSLTGSVIYSSASIADFEWIDIRLVPSQNFIELKVTVTSSDSRETLENFISLYTFGSPLNDITMRATLNDTSFISSVELEYSFSLPEDPGGEETSIIECVELTDMDYSFIDIIWSGCELETLVDSWFRNPLPFAIELTNLVFDVTFPDTDGVCFLFCFWDPLDTDVFFAHVVEPGPVPFIENPLPLLLAPSMIDVTTLRLNGFTNELCARLYEEFNGDKLVLNIVNGRAGVTVGSFYVAIPFEFRNFEVGSDPTPCETLLFGK